MEVSEEASRKIAIEMLTRQVGPVVGGLLEDPDVIEIILNQDGVLWAERLGKDMEEVGTMLPWQAVAMMGTVAKMMNTVINTERPFLECELPLDGSRFEAMIPPIVSAPVFALRKHPTKVFTLQEYVDKGIMTVDQKAIIEDAVINEKNIFVAGGTSSGKTTLVNAVIRYMSTALPKARLVILEDTRELRCSSKNHSALKTVVGAISMTDLLAFTMRLRPDRIIVGEVRDGAALAMIKAWNTGHPGGASTGHANSAYDALLRIESLVAEASSAPQYQLIASAINLVVYIERREGKRSIKEIIKVNGYENGRYLTERVG